MTRAAVWVATAGPVGYWPLGPGTLASALVGLLWWSAPSPRWAWAVAVAALVPLGAVCAGRAERVLGPDDGRIVVDELAGMGVALLGVPPGALGALLAFLLFRALDIGKPPPLGRLHAVRGGWGVMLDDIGAGAAAALIGRLAFALAS